MAPDGYGPCSKEAYGATKREPLDSVSREGVELLNYKRGYRDALAEAQEARMESKSLFDRLWEGTHKLEDGRPDRTAEP